jgi:hypothetical protein
MLREKAQGIPAGFERGPAIAAAAVVLAAAWLVACENSDPVAPEGSTITVSASPQTIPLPPGGGVGSSRITAVVRGKNGTRLPDQEVTFSTSAGTLSPDAQTILTTNDDGVAKSVLTTNATATVTAFSGSITGTTTVNIVSGDLANITLSADTQTIQTCSDEVELTANAADPNGDGVQGVAINFSRRVPSGFTELKGSFNPTQPRTDSFGDAFATFDIDDNWCSSHCSASDPNAPNGGVCVIEITAADITGTFVSGPVRIDENTP